MARMAALHVGEQPGEDVAPNLKENRILIAQWQEDVKKGLVSGDYHTRYLKKYRKIEEDLPGLHQP
jgi:hypothetical protein